MMLNKWSIIIGIFVGLSLYSLYFNIVSTPAYTDTSGSSSSSSATAAGHANNLRSSLHQLLRAGNEAASRGATSSSSSSSASGGSSGKDSIVVSGKDDEKLLTKFQVCLALRNAMLATHRGEVKRSADEEMQLQTFWDNLSCASVDLPPPPLSKKQQMQLQQQQEQINRDRKPVAPPPDSKAPSAAAVERPPPGAAALIDDDAPHAALLAAAGVPDFSASPVAIECTAMKRDYCLEPGKSWGKLSKAQQAHWLRLECDKWSQPDTDVEDIDACLKEYDRKHGTGSGGEAASASAPEPVVAPPSHLPQVIDSSSGIEGFDAADSAFCLEMKRNFSISPGASWGTMDTDHQVLWSRKQCDKYMVGDAPMPPPENSQEFAKALAYNIRNGLRHKSSSSIGKHHDKDVRDGMSDEEWCEEVKENYRVIPLMSWGKLPMNMVDSWKGKNCDAVFTKKRMAAAPISTCLNSPENSNSNSKKKDSKKKDKSPLKSTGLPLVAVMAATTSRKIPNPSTNSMAIFNFLLSSLIRNLDCGFEYVFVLGFDQGDAYYDNSAHMAEVKKWFENNVRVPLEKNGIVISLMPVKINNSLKKPGPVFIAMAREAYKAGADFFYRLNDDTEITAPFTKVFVNSIMSLSPPYGVVGPNCRQGNQAILTHDFVHRTHMEVFEMNYYPPELVDWWMDDWISVVYGYKRTFEARQSTVIHHTGAHGQRYDVNHDNKNLLANLVRRGREQIRTWMLKHNTSAADLREFEADTFNFEKRKPALGI